MPRQKQNEVEEAEDCSFRKNVFLPREEVENDKESRPSTGKNFNNEEKKKKEKELKLPELPKSPEKKTTGDMLEYMVRNNLMTYSGTIIKIVFISFNLLHKMVNFFSIRFNVIGRRSSRRVENIRRIPIK